MRRLDLQQFAEQDTGVSAVEFALVAPVLIGMLFGGYGLADCVALSRKLTVTTRALADLVSQYATMSTTDMQTVENASVQILAPFDATPLTMRISQITVTSVAGVTASLVSWSTAVGTSPYAKGLRIQLPTGMPTTIGLTYILAETSYAFAPPVGASIIGTVNLSDRIFMLPRVSTSVTYLGS